MTLAGLALQVLGFVYRIYLSRAAGAEALGLYRLILPVHSLSLALTIAGARMAETALSAELTLPADKLRVRLLTRICLTCYLCAYILLCVPTLLYSVQIASGFLGDARITPALPVMMGCIFLTGFELILESVFLGLKRTRVTAVSNLLEQIVQVVSVVAFLEFLRPTDPGEIARYIVIGMLLSEMPVVCWLLFSYVRVLRGTRRERVEWSRPNAPAVREPTSQERRTLWRRVLKYAIPVTLGGAVTTGLASLGTVLLPRRLVVAGLTEQEALSQLGIISGMAMPLMSLPMLFLNALSTVLLPAISDSRKNAQTSDTQRKIRKAVQAVGLIALPATAVLLPLAPELSRLLYDQELSNRYLLLLAISVVLADYQVVTMAILNGLGEQSRAIRNVIVGESVELCCVYLLAALPQVHIYGYILGMIACAGLITAANLRLIKRATGVRFGIRQCVGMPGVVALIAGLMTNAAYLSFCRSMDADWAVLPTLGVSVVTCIALYLLVGIRPIRYFKGLWVKHGRADGAE